MFVYILLQMRFSILVCLVVVALVVLLEPAVANDRDGRAIRGEKMIERAAGAGGTGRAAGIRDRAAGGGGRAAGIRDRAAGGGGTGSGR